jgi:predicted GH43/DUF377 family glycosyl hydrolase
VELQRHPENPLLEPDSESDWQSVNVFNPAVVVHDGRFHMLYRAQGKDGISRIGYASSQNGIDWIRSGEPVFEPAGDLEAMGVEDPRITEIDGVFYMAYTAFAGVESGEYLVTPMFARSSNLIEWERIGALVLGEDNKDHFLLPEKLRGRYIAFHRRPPDIWIAESESLSKWPKKAMQVVMSPRKGGWDSLRIGGNGPPIPTEDGWLFFYHGFDESRTYRLGVCLLDLENPGRVLRRPKDHIFEPSLSWEIEGNIPRVIFSCTNIVVGTKVYIYYGAADRVIGLATTSLEELLNYVLENRAC